MFFLFQQLDYIVFSLKILEAGVRFFIYGNLILKINDILRLEEGCGGLELVTLVLRVTGDGSGAGSL